MERYIWKKDVVEFSQETTLRRIMQLKSYGNICSDTISKYVLIIQQKD
jgi:hypothetical protein